LLTNALKLLRGLEGKMQEEQENFYCSTALLRSVKRIHLVVLVSVAIFTALLAYYAVTPTRAPTAEDVVAGVKTQFRVYSAVLRENELIPAKYTRDGEDVSPPLSWSGVPAEARSLVIVMYDPDAPSGIFYHWVLYNIPASINSIGENVPKTPVTPYGLQGVNSYGTVGYGGPYPPKGSRHRYVFLVLALDKELELGPGAHYSEVFKAVMGHVIAYARLTCVYERT